MARPAGKPFARKNGPSAAGRAGRGGERRQGPAAAAAAAAEACRGKAPDAGAEAGFPSGHAGSGGCGWVLVALGMKGAAVPPCGGGGECGGRGFRPAAGRRWGWESETADQDIQKGGSATLRVLPKLKLVVSGLLRIQNMAASRVARR